ncbi:hypothetical protein MY9_0545 [Bacillus sp. JS]|nr:hypothetical protein MY9_0545 [Bacillus sp. JS]
MFFLANLVFLCIAAHSKKQDISRAVECQAQKFIWKSKHKKGVTTCSLLFILPTKQV